MAIDYKNYEFMIYEYLIRLRQELLNNMQCERTEQWLKMIAEAQDRIKTRRFRVAVVGEFKKGKSSFINALLGRVVLPVDASPTTATINRIIYGAVPKAYLCYRDGSRQEVDIGNLAAYVTKLTEESAENAARIKEAVVEYPSIFCQNYVELIDTPGMNDDDSMNEVTVSNLSEIDLAIVAISALLPFSETECEFVVKLLESPEICQIIVVVTYIDAVRERDREKILSYLEDRIRTKVLEKLQTKYPAEDPIFQKYHQIFDNLNQFAVCSLDALDAYESGNHELLEKSGFPRLNNELPRLILNSQNNSSLQSAMNTIDRIVEESRKELPNMVNACKAKEAGIMKMREEFAKEGYHLANDSMIEAKAQMYELFNQFHDQLVVEIKRDFINCLSSVQTMDIGLLGVKLDRQKELSEQKLIDKIRNELNTKLYSMYSEEANRSMARTRDRLCALLQSYDDFSAELQGLRDLGDWRPHCETGKTGFRWLSPPIPPRQALAETDIIVWIEQALKKSLGDYVSRRKAEETLQIQRIVEDAAKNLENIVVELYRQSELYQKKLQEQITYLENALNMNGLEELAKENRDLREKFLYDLCTG